MTAAPEGNWAKAGDKLVLADALAENMSARGAHRRSGDASDVDPARTAREPSVAAPSAAWQLAMISTCPLLAGEHVTADTGTGFVHTAPGHGQEDFEIWTANARMLEERGSTAIPFTVDADGVFTDDAPGFEGKRVIDDKGNYGDANEAVIEALIDAGALIARGRLRHHYPHSWRSKKPVIFRNTPQWFVAMDKPIIGDAATPCASARCRPSTTRAGCRRQARTASRAMVETRPDWVRVAPARLGRADHRLRHKETGRVIPAATSMRRAS